MNVQSLAQMGFVYQVDTIKNGEVVDSITQHNLIPIQGINHMLDVTFVASAPVTQWYLGLYKANYAPNPSDTMATFPTLSEEATEYVNATRHELNLASAAAGLITNGANRSEVEFVIPTGETRTIRGGFIASTGTKGSTAGVLISAVQFASPRVVDNESILRVTAGLRIISTT